MRNIGVDEHYHVLNRGSDKQTIFRDRRDWIRFLFLILHFQSPSINFPQLGRSVSHFVKTQSFDIDDEVLEKIAADRAVELVAFALIPNHFHLILREVKEGGIARYMQRAEGAYAKYFNTKYERVGHLFQGSYKSVHVGDNDQLLYLSAYIHRNPRELKDWKGKEFDYPWSSFQDYINGGRWGNLLVSSIIFDQFNGGDDYKKFVGSSGAKDLDEELVLE